ERDWSYSSVVNENVQLAVSLDCQPNQIENVFPPFDVCACIGRLPARCCDAGCQSLKAIKASRSQYDLSPRSASRTAVASPIPLLAPVITTTLPLIPDMMFSFAF